jgi:hypothetical protein
MSKQRLALAVALAAAVSVVSAGTVGAYDNYSAGCNDCHGGFLTSPYISLVDGVSWGNDLHDVHRNNMLSGDCDVCHTGASKTPVVLNSSNGGTGLLPISCVGCHGRAEDLPSGEGYGAGLRRHHFNAGEAICADCHTDADPGGGYTPVNEGVLPPYYAPPELDHPNKPTDPFNPNGEEDYAGSPAGLDNDGNLAFDTADPAYVPEPSAALLQGAALLTLLGVVARRRS